MIKAIARWLVIITIVFSTCLTAISPVSAGGLGIGPAYLELKDAIRGGSYDQVITVFNIGSEGGEYSLSADGEIGPWINFYKYETPAEKIERVSIPGGGRVQVLARFSIPADAAAQAYKGTIYASSVPPEATAGGDTVGVTLNLQMPCPVTVTVTGQQKIQGEVNTMNAPPVEAGQTLPISVDFSNTGNVAARPKVHIQILKNGKVVDELVNDRVTVGPQKREVIIAEWDTAGLRQGDFIAKVKVTLGETIIEERELILKLLVVGVKEAAGEIIAFQTDEQVPTGRITKLSARYRNTGQVESRVQLVIDVFQGSEMLDHLKSEERLVAPGVEMELDIFGKFPEPGEYSVQAHINYDGKMTDTRESYLTVTGSSTSQGNNNFFTPMLITAGITLAGAGIYIGVTKLLHRNN